MTNPTRSRTILGPLLACGALALAPARPARAQWVWVEGEKPVRSTMHRHPYWFDQVKRDQFSGGDFISNFDKQPGEASYRFRVPAAGDYEFWVRAEPVLAKLSYALDGGKSTPINLDQGQRDSVNVAADGKPDLRFLAWVRVGKLTLKKGEHRIAFRMDGTENNHGYLDCFVFTTEPFAPRGTLKPDQLADADRRAGAAEEGWFAFNPPTDGHKATSGIDLRFLNEKSAGEGGFIGVKDGQFVHSKTGKSLRFWAVNGPPAKDLASLRQEARMLAKHGVNLVRIHHGYYDADGKPNPEAFRQVHDEGRGDLLPLLDLLPALAVAQARQPHAQGLRRRQAPVRRSLLQQGLPGPLPPVVEGPDRDAEPLDRQAPGG
jgi:hypothetical protein